MAVISLKMNGRNVLDPWSVSRLQTSPGETLTIGPKPCEIPFYRLWCAAGPWAIGLFDERLLVACSWVVRV